MSAAGFVNLIRKEILKTMKNEYTGIELGTVTAPFPELAVKVDNMKVELKKQDLIVCERLARNTRTVSLTSQPGQQRDTGDGISAVDANSFGQPVSFSHVQLDSEDLLKPGDRVLIEAVPGGQKYIIIDRVVQYG